MLHPDIKRLLKIIKERPGLYLGRKTLAPLADLLGGYMLCLFEHYDVPSLEYLPGFQNFVAERYDIRSAHHWSQIIKFHSVTDEKAFDTFYELLEEFYGDELN